MAVRLEDGSVLVVGGQRTSAELHDPDSGIWAPAGSTKARFGQTAVLLEDGRVLIAGGFVESRGYFLTVASAELYDPFQGTWSPAEGMIEARALHTAVLLADGMALVTGGVIGDFGPLGSVELFDASTGKWSPAGP